MMSDSFPVLLWIHQFIFNVMTRIRRKLLVFIIYFRISTFCVGDNAYLNGKTDQYQGREPIAMFSNSNLTRAQWSLSPRKPKYRKFESSRTTRLNLLYAMEKIRRQLITKLCVIRINTSLFHIEYKKFCIGDLLKNFRFNWDWITAIIPWPSKPSSTCIKSKERRWNRFERLRDLSLNSREPPTLKLNRKVNNSVVYKPNNVVAV